jgi:hypothetical protein
MVTTIKFHRVVGILIVLSLDLTLLPKKGTNAAYMAESTGFMTGFFQQSNGSSKMYCMRFLTASSQTFAHGLVM